MDIKMFEMYISVYCTVERNSGDKVFLLMRKP